jgi:hypothetical protein
MDSLTVSSSIISPTGDKPITPAMVTALWVIAHEVDRLRIPATVEDAIWLEIPTVDLRGTDGRDDNVWLRECLRRLTGLQIGGEYRSNPWGAVILAEWHILQGGSTCKLLIPPAGIQALRTPETFAKIETHAAYKLEGPARRLYAALADKKRLGQPHWIYSLEELRTVLGVENRKAYQRWNNFRQRVLNPALEQINDYGTVTVKMTPQKLGRSINTVRFDWRWKTIDEARETEEENERPALARHQDKTKRDAAPLIPEELPERPKRTEEQKKRALESLEQAKKSLRSGPTKH